MSHNFTKLFIVLFVSKYFLFISKYFCCRRDWDRQLHVWSVCEARGNCLRRDQPGHWSLVTTVPPATGHTGHGTPGECPLWRDSPADNNMQLHRVCLRSAHVVDTTVVQSDHWSCSLPTLSVFTQTFLCIGLVLPQALIYYQNLFREFSAFCFYDCWNRWFHKCKTK